MDFSKIETYNKFIKNFDAPVGVEVTPSISDYDRKVNVLARTLMGEGEAESEDAVKGIASTIYNRAGGDSSKFASEALKKDQYSCWNKISDESRSDLSKLTYKDHGHAKTSPEAWERSKRIAKEMMDGKFKPTTEATHYFNPNKANPKWGSNMKGESTIGNHKFGKPRTADELKKLQEEQLAKTKTDTETKVAKAPVKSPKVSTRVTAIKNSKVASTKTPARLPSKSSVKVRPKVRIKGKI